MKKRIEIRIDLLRATPVWPREDLKKLAKLWNAEWRICDIARELGRNNQQIHNKVQALLRRQGDMEESTNSKPRKDTSEAKVRRCLKCRKKFLSEWSGHRQCDGCKANERYRNGSVVEPMTTRGLNMSEFTRYD